MSFFDDDYYAAAIGTPAAETGPDDFGGEDYDTSGAPDGTAPVDDEDDALRVKQAADDYDAAVKAAAAAISESLSVRGEVTLGELRHISESHEAQPHDVAFSLGLRADPDAPTILRRAAPAQPEEEEENDNQPEEVNMTASAPTSSNSAGGYEAAADYLYAFITEQEDQRCRVDDIKERVCELIGKERLRESTLLKVLALQPALEYDSDCKQPKLHSAKWLRVVPGALAPTDADSAGTNTPTADEDADNADNPIDRVYEAPAAAGEAVAPAAAGEAAAPEPEDAVVYAADDTAQDVLPAAPELLYDVTQRIQADTETAWCGQFTPAPVPPAVPPAAPTPSLMSNKMTLAQAHTFMSNMSFEFMRAGVRGEVAVDTVEGVQVGFYVQPQR